MRKEYIPDNDFLYRRVKYDDFNKKRGKFSAPAFMLRKERNEKGLSVNWAKYSTPEKTSIDPRNNKYCVGEFKAIVPRKVDLDVNHTPNKHNQSHCTISGEKLFDDIEAYPIAGIIAENCIPIIINK